MLKDARKTITQLKVTIPGLVNIKVNWPKELGQRSSIYDKQRIQ